MLKKNIFLSLALLMVGLAVVPQVQAQTQQQQQELEQIARRSVSGLSPQDRQRVVQIMIDVFIAQGMPRQQAVAMAEMSADSMFSTDIDEMSPEQRRMFEEQERSLAELEQRQRQPQQPQQQRQPGENAGWPAAQLRERGLANLQQPTGTQASYNGNANWVEIIYLTGANANILQTLKRQIETIAGKTMDGSGNRFSVVYRQSGSGRMTSQSFIHIELSGTQITISLTEGGA